MTVICYKNGVVAADKKSSGWVDFTTSKLRRFNGDIYGLAGSTSRALEVLDWIMEGGDFPVLKEDETVQILKVGPGGIWLYHNTKTPFQVEDDYVAIGSGAQYALGAMACGATAKEAVEVAIRYDYSCGRGVDVEYL